MSKKFAKDIVRKLQAIRYKLEDMQNCEDGHEMIVVALDLACDLEQIEEQLGEKYDI